MSKQVEINTAIVGDFIKDLVEIGDVYYIDEQGFIKGKISDEPTTIKVKDKALPIMIYHEGMKAGEWVVLNPFVETMSSSAEKEWFFSSRSIIIGFILRKMILKIAEHIVSITDNPKGEGEIQEDTPYASMEFISPYLDRIDAKALKELELIKANDLAYIHYDRKLREASLFCRVMDDEFRSEFGSKIRKRTWEFVIGLVEAFLQTDNPELMYRHKSTIIGMQMTDAMLHVLVKTLRAIHLYTDTILGVDLKVATLVKHMDHLEEYHKLCQWFASPSIKEDEAPKNKPWSVGQSNMSTKALGVPAAALPNPKQEVIRNLSDRVQAGVIRNIATPTITTASSYGMVPQVPMFAPSSLVPQPIAQISTLGDNHRPFG